MKKSNTGFYCNRRELSTLFGTNSTYETIRNKYNVYKKINMIFIDFEVIKKRKRDLEKQVNKLLTAINNIDNQMSLPTNCKDTEDIVPDWDLHTHDI